jgi:hypothetical protein
MLQSVLYQKGQHLQPKYFELVRPTTIALCFIQLLAEVLCFCQKTSTKHRLTGAENITFPIPFYF